MVSLVTKLLVFAAAILAAEPAFALLGQTASDLAVLEDTLRDRIERERSLKERVAPLILAPPVHYWRESREDFQAAVTETVTKGMGEGGEVIACLDCDTWRLHVREGQSLNMQNGEIALEELGRLKQNPLYRSAKALATVSETPSGVAMRITSLDDGRVLFFALADSSATLDDAKPFFNYAKERDRRLRGESLSYVFINTGLYPNGMFQLEFLEQWGERNQHLSGIGLSLFNPTFALGLVYHYMLPGMPRLHASGAVYYPLQNALASAVDDDQDVTDKFVAQLMIQGTFSDSYGIFASLNTEGTFSIGVNFYNPLFMPFLF